MGWAATKQTFALRLAQVPPKATKSAFFTLRATQVYSTLHTVQPEKSERRLPSQPNHSKVCTELFF